MTDQKHHYEELLATYSQSAAAIELLKHHRPYLELLPSMRRPEESLITLPLPIARLRRTQPGASGQNLVTIEPVLLPCEVALLMCDPEWKIKTGREVLVFIHQPDEDFSDFLGRWRRTQILLGKDYEWLLPPRYQHFLNDGAEKIYPLFVVFDETPDRIIRGLKGAHLPFVRRPLLEQTVDLSQDRAGESAADRPVQADQSGSADSAGPEAEAPPERRIEQAD
jgi:hypothetical protein